ncbi:uncharacterized protein Z518_00366 [Rhinocladiella mackenziei CBS 650.93]|uniref:Uncharacterized protein n=1 Tax=Rhinocladiella mackenziei CBS 650.93 TaxID=1442369 RepID=A0A0D2G3U1_9EURO|nr:uncharacterized protein Z518_00366 [Rhinocladiella mackenziei CBS 650.93]KIX09287.1 hypothetical protein Z518_00366 [Rhinocladiella mackenziei CBS 650.93]
MPEFLINMTLSTTPQATFAQADALLLQAAELKNEAAQLQSRIDTINERVEIMTTTASGLQAIANQDRESIQFMFERSLEVYEDVLGAYERIPRRAARLDNLKVRVEDGMATVEELEGLLQDMVELRRTGRLERSQAPEPENLPTQSTTVPSIEASQSEIEQTPTFSTSIKRNMSAIQDESEDESPETMAPKKIKLGGSISRAEDEGADSGAGEDGSREDTSPDETNSRSSFDNANGRCSNLESSLHSIDTNEAKSSVETSLIQDHDPGYHGQASQSPESTNTE